MKDNQCPGQSENILLPIISNRYFSEFFMEAANQYGGEDIRMCEPSLLVSPGIVGHSWTSDNIAVKCQIISVD